MLQNYYEQLKISNTNQKREEAHFWVSSSLAFASFFKDFLHDPVDYQSEYNDVAEYHHKAESAYNSGNNCDDSGNDQCDQKNNS